jgi:hypothetical protein
MYSIGNPPFYVSILLLKLSKINNGYANYINYFKPKGILLLELIMRPCLGGFLGEWGACFRGFYIAAGF